MTSSSKSPLKDFVHALAESPLAQELNRLQRAWTSPETQRLLEERFLKPVRLFGRAVDEALAPFRTPEFLAAVAELVERVQLLDRWFKEAPEYLKAALVDAGTIPHPELTLDDLASVLRAYGIDGEKSAVARVQELNEELFAEEGFRKSLATRWQASRRRAVLEQILSAHDAGLYAVSVPAALAQAEGIVADAVQHTGQMKLQDLKDHIAKLRHEPNLDGPSVEHFVENFLFARFKHGDQVPPFSRHAILHGADVGYGTKEKSIRALVWVDYLLVLVEARAKLSPVVGQGEGI